MLERTASDLKYDEWDFLWGQLDHENGHARAALGWANQQGIEIPVVYGLWIYHEKTTHYIIQKPLLFTGFPDIADRVGWDKGKYLACFDYIFQIQRVPPMMCLHMR